MNYKIQVIALFILGMTIANGQFTLMSKSFVDDNFNSLEGIYLFAIYILGWTALNVKGGEGNIV